jgi:hypothetical protein
MFFRFLTFHLFSTLYIYIKDEIPVLLHYGHGQDTVYSKVDTTIEFKDTVTVKDPKGEMTLSTLLFLV